MGRRRTSDEDKMPLLILDSSCGRENFLIVVGAGNARSIEVKSSGPSAITLGLPVGGVERIRLVKVVPLRVRAQDLDG